MVSLLPTAEDSSMARFQPTQKVAAIQYPD